MKPGSASWQFDATDAWRIHVEIPRFPERTSEFCDLVVPQIARLAKPAPETPCVVVARVSVTAARPRGPKGFAKAVLDALHDERQGGAKYAQFGTKPPLPDDDSRYVHGLAVEVAVGERNCVEYRLGTRLLVAGVRLASVPVGRHAPNDAWADASERERIEADRAEFARDLAESWNTKTRIFDEHYPTALVVHHHPVRDEDNTWRTWTGALLGAKWASPLWSGGLPLRGWAPRAVASVVDARLASSTRYDLWSDGRSSM